MPIHWGMYTSTNAGKKVPYIFRVPGSKTEKPRGHSSATDYNAVRRALRMERMKVRKIF